MDDTEVQIHAYFVFDDKDCLNVQITSDPFLELDLSNLYQLLDRDLWNWPSHRQRIFEMDGRLARMNTLPYSFDGQRCPDLGVAFGQMLSRYLQENAFALKVVSGSSSGSTVPLRQHRPKYGDILLPTRGDSWTYSIETTSNDQQPATLEARFTTADDGWLEMLVDCSTATLKKEIALVAEYLYHRLPCNHDGALYGLLDRPFVLYDPDHEKNRPTPRCEKALQSVLRTFVLDRKHDLRFSVVQLDTA